MQRFGNKVAFVTGAAHGIGRATVLRLAMEGSAVGAADIDAEGTAAVVAEVAATGGSGVALSCDITDEDVAAAIAFLASEDASWITGITLPVEGGLTSGPGHLLNLL